MLSVEPVPALRDDFIWLISEPAGDPAFAVDRGHTLDHIAYFHPDELSILFGGDLGAR